MSTMRRQSSRIAAFLQADARPMFCWPQRRRSVVKSGGRAHSGQAIKLEADRNSLLFSAPKMGYLVIFGFFSVFGQKRIFVYFSFSFVGLPIHDTGLARNPPSVVGPH